MMKKVLFFTYDFPYPTTSGGKMRAYNMIKYAVDGVDVRLFSFVRPGFSKQQAEAMKDIGVRDVEVFPRRKVKDVRNLGAFFSGASIFKHLYYEKAIAQRLFSYVTSENIDSIHFESFYPAFYLDKRYQSLGVKQIYGSENIEHRLYEDYVRYNVTPLLKPAYHLQARKIKQEEDAFARLADATLAVTESEKNYFTSVSQKPAYVIENGVSLSEFAYKKRMPGKLKTILFVGNFSYFPNYDAVTFFYHEVFSQLPEQHLRFSIIGKGSSQFAKFGDERIVTTEFVKDIRDAYYGADVFVSPIKIGGGTNFKILEAMATGLPVVTFSDRMRDIGGRDGEDVLSADDADSFREQVVKVLDNAALAEKLAKNARKIIERKYSWDIIGRNLNELWKSL